MQLSLGKRPGPELKRTIGGILNLYHQRHLRLWPAGWWLPLEANAFAYTAFLWLGSPAGVGEFEAVVQNLLVEGKIERRRRPTDREVWDIARRFPHTLICCDQETPLMRHLVAGGYKVAIFSFDSRGLREVQLHGCGKSREVTTIWRR